MGKKIEMKGQKFIRLLVLYECEERKNGLVVWRCKCDCGKEVEVRGCDLRSGKVISCGCLGREKTIKACTTHGFTRGYQQHTLYRKIAGMIQRCENPNDRQYHNYGARGITVCPEWHDPKTFYDWAISNGWEEGLQIDRIDVDGGYEPGNCRFVTIKEQQRNKQNTYWLEWQGKLRRLVDLAEEYGVPNHVLHHRLNNGWPLDQALNKPIAVRGKHYVTFNGNRRALYEWAEDLQVKALGIKYNTLKQRINKLHWPIERALTEPVKRGL